MYRVTWLDSVTLELLRATARANSPLRDRILEAMSEIETLLQNDPDTAGESRGPRRRVLIHLPLSITFEIEQRSREVVVLEARVYQSRK
jgi:hypothetical protein